MGPEIYNLTALHDGVVVFEMGLEVSDVSRRESGLRDLGGQFARFIAAMKEHGDWPPKKAS